jgi:flagellar biosynthesis protein FlhF
MQVKKFLVNDMSEAMPLIRAELGPEAIILHSEKAPKSGLKSWFGRQKLQVIAAVDQDQRDFPQPTSATDRSIQAMQQEISALKANLARTIPHSREGRSFNPGPPSLRPAEGTPRPILLDDWYRRLLDCGLIETVAQRLVQTAGETLSRWALDNSEVLSEQIRWQLSRQLTVAPFEVNAGYDAVHFLVGPTGVGKTTTVAKLAEHLSNRHPVIITIDTFRIGAVPQITMLGELLGVPVEIAYSPQELAHKVANYGQGRIVLIDTPGRSPYAADDLLELGHYLAAVPDKTVHLTLAAGAKFNDMHHTLEAFGPQSIDNLIFTKIDETETLGAAFSLACETGLPLSYLTRGQRVPEDLEPAAAERMVEFIMGGSKPAMRQISGQARRNGGAAGWRFQASSSDAPVSSSEAWRYLIESV